MFKTIRLLKRSRFILERSQSFSLREVEKDLSLAAMVAGFMKISLHNVITFYHFPFWVGLFLIYSVYLSVRLSLPVTLVTFELTILCYLWLHYFRLTFFCLIYFYFCKNVKAPTPGPSSVRSLFRVVSLAHMFRVPLVLREPPPYARFALLILYSTTLLFANRNRVRFSRV